MKSVVYVISSGWKPFHRDTDHLTGGFGMKWAKVTWEGDKITQNVLGMKWAKVTWKGDKITQNSLGLKWVKRYSLEKIPFYSGIIIAVIFDKPLL
jgi:hypothetical protein